MPSWSRYPLCLSRSFFALRCPWMDGWPDQFAIVTAYNPDGLSAEPAVNAGADAMLRAALEKMDLKHFRLTGGSRDEAHQEPGWGFWPATPRQRQTDGASKTTSFSAGTPKVVELDSDCRFTHRGTALALAPPLGGRQLLLVSSSRSHTSIVRLVHEASSLTPHGRSIAWNRRSCSMHTCLRRGNTTRCSMLRSPLRSPNDELTNSPIVGFTEWGLNLEGNFSG